MSLCNLKAQIGLIGKFPFSGNANDVSGQGHNGIVNGATLTADRFGNANSAYLFDGVNDYIDIGQGFSYSSHSFSCWARKDDINGNNQIVSKINNGPFDTKNSELSVDGFVVGTGNAWVGINSQNPNVNFSNWSHIVGSYDVISNKVKIYTDGVADSILAPTYFDVTNTNIFIGARPFWGGANATAFYFKGAIDDLYMFDYSLSKNQVDSLFNLPNPCAPTNFSQTLTLCAGQTVTVGLNTYNSTGIYTDILSKVNGCDSIITTNLTVNAAINVGTTLNGLTLSANLAGATYQWLNNCPNYTVIAGATNQSYTVLANGNYAVIVTVGNCSDTSLCTNINTVGIESTDNDIRIAAYPNPANSVFTISGIDASAFKSVEIIDLSGAVVLRKNTYSDIDISSLSNGFYFYKVIGSTTFTGKIIKQ